VNLVSYIILLLYLFILTKRLYPQHDQNPQLLLFTDTHLTHIIYTKLPALPSRKISAELPTIFEKINSTNRLRPIQLSIKRANTAQFGISPKSTNLLHNFTRQLNPCLGCRWIQTNVIEVYHTYTACNRA